MRLLFDSNKTTQFYSWAITVSTAQRIIQIHFLECWILIEFKNSKMVLQNYSFMNSNTYLTWINEWHSFRRTFLYLTNTRNSTYDKSKLWTYFVQYWNYVWNCLQMVSRKMCFKYISQDFRYWRWKNSHSNSFEGVLNVAEDETSLLQVTAFNPYQITQFVQHRTLLFNSFPIVIKKTFFGIPKITRTT